MYNVGPTCRRSIHIHVVHVVQSDICMLEVYMHYPACILLRSKL